MNRVYFSLGSNLGDRRKNILEAVRLMGERFSEMEGTDCRPVALSSLIETEPWGFESETSPPQYDTEGRRIYSSRPIDIDILLYGDETLNTPDLIIPHPRMKERDFVLIPLHEIM